MLLQRGPTVWDAIGDLPEAEEYGELVWSDSVRAKFGKPSEYASILRGIRRDETDLAYPRDYDAKILTSSRLAEHTELSRKRFADTRPGNTEPVSRFLKLDPNGVSNTLRAGTASDRGAFTSPRPIHPFTSRCITVREAARLHSYPDWFRFHFTKWHGFRQIGNSVPPLLGRAVALQLAAVLGAPMKKPRRLLQLGNAALLSLNMKEAAEHFGVPSDVIARRIRPEAESAVVQRAAA